MLDITDYLTTIAFNTTIFKRDRILLIDNIMNNDAELVDNFTLFEYLQKQPQFRDISYYIINRNNVKYKEISQKYRNIITIDNCKVNLSLLSHIAKAKYWLDSFQMLNRLNLQDYFKNSQIINVYTQHGINYFKSGFLGNQEIGSAIFRKIIFSNENERQLFKKYYSYADDNTILAGLARWDLIPDKTTGKEILLYFTFRSYLRDPGISIEETNYYKNILKLLSSDRLNNLLKKHNLILNLALHHEAQRYMNHNLPKIGNIKIIKDIDIGKCKKNSSMLITDFSSMCFDFMYKNRPVIFYRIDKDDPLLMYDEEGHINDVNVESKNNELYNICYSADDVIDLIAKYIDNGFKLEVENIAKNDNFFTFRSDICSHIITEILKSPTNIYNSDEVPLHNEIEYGVEYSFFHHNNPFVLTGVSHVESWGCWSNNKEVKLGFRLPQKNKNKDIQLTLQLLVFIARKKKKQVVDIFANDQHIAGYKLCENKATLKLIIPATLLDNGVLNLKFCIKKPQSPKEVGISSDSRKLAIGFTKMTINPVTD